jgi:acetylornithine deacetylase/succinyl-diaminopimelate desuccinylase-like protein
MRLGEIGDVGDGAMMRVTGSEADGRARDRVVSWFEDAGLDVRVDPIGNIVGRREGQIDRPPVLTGSHIDTVPCGGKFDGTAGVLTALEAVRAWDDAGVETDRPVEVVVFTEEEGTRFGTGLLGSLVATRGIVPRATCRVRFRYRSARQSRRYGAAVRRRHTRHGGR